MLHRCEDTVPLLPPSIRQEKETKERSRKGTIDNHGRLFPEHVRESDRATGSNNHGLSDSISW